MLLGRAPANSTSYIFKPAGATVVLITALTPALMLLGHLSQSSQVLPSAVGFIPFGLLPFCRSILFMFKSFWLGCAVQRADSSL